LLATALQELSAEALTIRIEETNFRWYEVLGVSPNSDASAIRRAITRFARLYHPDKAAGPNR